MKNKEFIFEFENDWKQLKGKWNWYNFTFVNFYIEHDKWLKGICTECKLLGLGIYIRFNYDVEYLKKFLTDEDEELEVSLTTV